MMFLTHVSFAFLISLLIIRFSGYNLDFVFVIMVLLGSVLPDLDSAKSFIGRKIRVVSIFLKHRAFFHSLLTAVFLGVIIFLLTQNSFYSLGFITGFVSHLLLDSLTRTGVTPFWPSRLKLRGGLITGSWPDWFLFLLFLALCLVIIF